jgi:hypothetical protein
MATKIDRRILEAALIGIETQKKELDERAAQIRQMLNGNEAGAIAATSEPAPRKRRTLSAAARKRIAEAQKARWAKVRGESQAKAEAPKAKRKLSPSARAKLVANLKKARAAKAAKTKSAAA